MTRSSFLLAFLAFAAFPRSAAANEVRNVDLGTTYLTIQEAMDDPGIAPGHTILVLPGQYTDAFTIDVDVTVKSEYETNPTALKETVLRHPTAYTPFNVLAGSLEGFTITGRNAYGDALGVYVAGTGTLTRNSVANVLGYGVYALDSARILYNVIRGNAPCGALGGASGAGISAADDALIMGNIIEDNYGLCDYNCGSPEPPPGGGSADGSALRGGGPLFGGGIIAGDNVRIVSNLIRRNCALSGAGIYLQGPAVAVNNTILKNKGQGAVLLQDATFANNIVAFSVNVGVQVNAGSPTIDNNLFWSNAGGDGSTGTDAILADPLLRPDDIRLRPLSPAVDAADDSWVLADDLDLSGRPRILGDHVDVGADELLGHQAEIVAEDGPGGPTLDPPAPSPRAGGGDVTFRFALPAAETVRLTVHDVLGRRVAAREAEDFAAGEHGVRWNPGDLAAGYYFVRLTTGTGRAVTTPWIVLR